MTRTERIAAHQLRIGDIVITPSGDYRRVTLHRLEYRNHRPTACIEWAGVPGTELVSAAADVTRLRTH